MATIVNNPGSDSGASAAAWMVGIIALVAVVLIALFVWPGFAAQNTQAPSTNINVQVPTPDVGGAQE